MADLLIQPGCGLTVYADATAVYALRSNKLILYRHLEQTVDSILQWMLRWRLKISRKKCTAVHFTYRLQPTPTNIVVGVVALSWSHTSRYMGLIVDQRFSWR
ncbi:Reverse transcriptase (RNA-dependent DNA polymerase) [Popillia japonica]|uniref:Reverse transcriptase (RNA-dependent DNA polymerase) n=1 Tax=Popillia japonica TaxID=7064 RepID=A0AAW1K5S9_POPJA